PHLAGRRDDERVDLTEQRVHPDKARVELLDDAEDLLLLAWIVHACAEDQPSPLVGLESFERVDVQPRERVWVLLGDLFDLDPSFGREHEEWLLRAPVESEREVVLLRDLGRLLDPEPAHDVASNVEPED